MHKAIIFDLGNTILPFDFKHAYRELESCCPYASAEIGERFTATKLAEPFELGLIEPHEFVRQVSEALHLRIDYAEFCKTWNSIFTQPVISEAMIAGLAARYRLVLLSNTNAIHFEMIRAKQPFMRHFHELVASHEVHALKPQAEIYRIAVERAGCSPRECLYVDDIASYVETARKMGIDAVTFRSTEQLEADLAAREIEWQ
ncbi:MAG TPA: HAD family phosphatase [Bryobacteraceae bacterium]|nr:HAD family phosphatase [Bryobacteraceae bacterium]